MKNESLTGTVRVRPQVHRGTDELGAVVAVDALRQSALEPEPLQCRGDVLTVEAVNIDVSRDGGVTWTPIATNVANTANASGTVAWTVTGPATTTARIRVRWVTDAALEDVSNVNFRIQ